MYDRETKVFHTHNFSEWKQDEIHNATKKSENNEFFVYGKNAENIMEMDDDGFYNMSAGSVVGVLLQV